MSDKSTSSTRQVVTRRQTMPTTDILENRSSECAPKAHTATPTAPIEDDLLIAATALEKLKHDTRPQQSTPRPSQSHKLLNKVIFHPIISNSINFVLEKAKSKDLDHGGCDGSDAIVQRRRARAEDASLEEPDHSTKKQKFSKDSTPLRNQISVRSATKHKSINDLRNSTLTLNIESRKKLTMLIQFLKLGNYQLNERIEKLIHSVDEKRDKLGVSKEELNIQQIKTDIVATIKKIVTVVSKVSADSLSEPARSKVKDAILNLPTNWATMLDNQDNTMDIPSSDDDDLEEHEADEKRQKSEHEYNDAKQTGDGNQGEKFVKEGEKEIEEKDETKEEIPTITVNHKTMFQRERKASISRRIMNSLIEYRKSKGLEFDSSKKKLNNWFKNKIRNQILNDQSGKVLVLAQESLDMINKIIKFCDESLDKADHWNTIKQQEHQRELLERLKQSGDSDQVETIIVKTKGTEKNVD
ncbi:unnamed protein product [Pichia kudriavzevii]